MTGKIEPERDVDPSNTIAKRKLNLAPGSRTRKHRGIFRMSPQPPPDPGLYSLVALVQMAQRSPVGIFSHQTGLSRSELTDVQPPNSTSRFGRGGASPSILQIRSAEVGTGARGNISGVPFTNAARTIVDIWHEGMLRLIWISHSSENSLPRCA